VIGERWCVYVNAQPQTRADGEWIGFDPTKVSVGMRPRLSLAPSMSHQAFQRCSP
jgi:hypothetical protein